MSITVPVQTLPRGAGIGLQDVLDEALVHGKVSAARRLFRQFSTHHVVWVKFNKAGGLSWSVLDAEIRPETDEIESGKWHPVWSTRSDGNDSEGDKDRA